MCKHQNSVHRSRRHNINKDVQLNTDCVDPVSSYIRFPVYAVQFPDYANGFPTYEIGYHAAEIEIKFPTNETNFKNINCEITSEQKKMEGKLNFSLTYGNLWIYCVKFSTNLDSKLTISKKNKNRRFLFHRFQNIAHILGQNFSTIFQKI